MIARYLVFEAAHDPSLHIRVGDRRVRTDVYATAVMIWNRGSAKSREPSTCRIVVKPRRPVVAARVLSAPRPGARLSLDLSRAQQGEIGVSWRELDAGDGVALHFAVQGGPSEAHVHPITQRTYWRADSRQWDALLLITLSMALLLQVVWYFPQEHDMPIASTFLLLFLIAFWAFVGSLLPGYIQRPPMKLRAAIAERYPQPMISSPDR